MRGIMIAAIAAFVFTANAVAADPHVLQAGDILEVKSAGNLTVAKLRTALREYGYHGFSYGDHFGHIIKITAVASDGRIYRLKVHMRTHEVTLAHRVRHVF